MQEEEEEKELTVANNNNDDDINSIFQDAITKLDNIDSQAKKEKKQVIKETAKQLEGKIPLESISIEIVNQLRGRVSERLVHQSLDEKYKKKYRVENALRKKEKKKKEKKESLAAISLLNTESKEEKNIAVVAVDTAGNQLEQQKQEQEKPILQPEEHNTKCNGCKEWKQMYKELQDKADEYEDALNKASPLMPASQIANNNKNNGSLELEHRTTNADASNEIVDFEAPIPWEEMLIYLHTDKSQESTDKSSDKSQPIWFNGKINKKTGQVIAAYPGRISERNKETQQEFV
jgi:hypothetical protein